MTLLPTYQPVASAADEGNQKTNPTSADPHGNKTDNNQGRFVFLDGFRGLCALSVVLSHSAMNCGFGGDYGAALVAVPGFFVLSSFLIVYQLLKLLHQGTVRHRRDLKPFLLIYACKRFFRIYPLFFLVTSLFYIFPKYSNDCGEYIRVVALLYSGNCVLWTIRPEVYNYIWMPFFALSIHFSKWSILGWMAFFAYAETHWTRLRRFASTTEEWSSLIVQGWTTGFMAGGFLAVTYFYLSPIYCSASRTAVKKLKTLVGSNADRILLTVKLIYEGIIGICVMQFIRYVFLRYNPAVEIFQDFHNNSAFAMACILFLMLFVKDDGMSTWLFRTPLLCFLGKISYSYYLSHTLVIRYLVVEVYPGWSSWEALLFYASVSAVVATASFYLIEQPLMRLGGRICSRIQKKYAEAE
jgi:peptidoglycan/LPS O-acetylase OafA/YrhL